ncbi:hypothetical protein NC652_007767 [Populus alba x Populus x berolinensis]|uniref:Uncharacterized protein n=1 Tax=Populus alba x Populus x berolinensis TaxID=444605 RepID=A0AAD6W992_9ROSI|nr:hypothetical protein NC652_007767 [Populus alba x Populus x berolinensis]KAJ7002439.1 hypothetical protein NC653_007802 [Populus alba x Populus x berolinensis]
MLLDFLTLRCPLSLSPSKKRKKKINSFDLFLSSSPNRTRTRTRSRTKSPKSPVHYIFTFNSDFFLLNPSALPCSENSDWTINYGTRIPISKPS